MNRAPLFALATLFLATSPASAAPSGAGQPCAANVTGATNDHLGHRIGEMHGGPWVVPAAADVTLTCEIEIGQANCYDTTNVGLRGTSEPLPSVGLLDPRYVEYYNPYLMPTYLGTTVSWTDAGGARVVENVDFDATKPGAQCAVLDWGNEG